MIAPTTARMICVWTTAGIRGGVPFSFGLSASAVPSTAASGKRTSASPIVANRRNFLEGSHRPLTL